MKTVSQDFRTALKDIRELNGVVIYKSLPSRLVTQAEEPIITQDGRYIGISEKDLIYNVLSTEYSNILTTEANKLIGTERNKKEINNEAINSMKIEFNGGLLKTICRYITIDSKVNIPLKTKINAKIGLKVNGSMEYIDEGYFYNIEPGKWQLDTNSYLITGYDAMYRCMKEYEGLTFPNTHKGLIEEILNKFGIDYNLSSYANQDYPIEEDLWTEGDFTYRDVLDELCTSGGFNLLIENNIAVMKNPYDTEEVIDAEEMQDNDVSISEKYGPINKVVIHDMDDNYYVVGQDDTSIIENGECEFDLGHNRVLLNDFRLHESVFNSIKGLWFYYHDILTKGLLVFDPLDIFEIKHKGRYKTILLNDTIVLEKGLTETTFIEEIEQKEKEYITSAPDKERLKDAIVDIDRANGQIVLKATSDGKLVQAELKADASTGSEFNVSADQINFNSHTFNLTTDQIKIESENFKVDEEGNLRCNNAIAKDLSIEGGNINMISTPGDTSAFILNANPEDPQAPRTTLKTYCNGIRAEETEDYKLSFDLSAVGNNMGDYYGSLRLFDGYDGTQPTIELNGEIGNGIFESIEVKDVYYENLHPQSLEEKKKNFEKLENALDIVKDVDIYKYNYKNEQDDEKKHIGFVIGDKFKYRKEITTKENNAAELYSMISVLWRAIQEQQKEIEELKKEVKHGL